MPPLLPVPTLESSACSVLSRLLAQAFARLEANERRTRRQKAGGEEEEKEIGEILDFLPTALLEGTAQKILNLLTSKVVPQPGSCTDGGWYASHVRGGITTTIPGVPTALRLLLRPVTSSFDIGGFISVARLSRSFSLLCEKSLTAGLTRANRLVKLHLRRKCSDAVLAIVASSCPLIKQIDISHSEQVTNSGLKHLHFCPTLLSLNLLKCWALTPAGVGGLLLALPRIHLLFFANMTAVMEAMSMEKEEESVGPFFLQHFDNSDYTMAVPREGVGPPWMDGLTSFANISTTFPHISSCRLVASDREIEHLKDLPHLRQLEVEFSDEPEDGLFSFLTEHPNRAHFTHLALETGPLLSSHLEALASNCPRLQNFRFIGFKVEDARILKNVQKDFKNLKELDICMYDGQEEESSSDEDDDEDESGLEGRFNIEVVSFFLESAINLEVVKLHMNFGSYLNSYFLSSLLDKNPLHQTSHLHISSQKTVHLDEEALRMVLRRMPELTSLKVSSWDLDYHCCQARKMKELREEARENNLDISYF